MIFIVPIEPYEQRYTKQWRIWFEEAVISLGYNYKIIDGYCEKDNIDVGSVLDAYSTSRYKLSQLSQLILCIKDGIVKDNDSILLLDGEFPGVDTLFYIRNMTKRKFKVCAFFHAGSYDTSDFTYREGMSYWMQWIERGWFAGYDKIFVASEYHKDMIIRKRGISDKKIFVTGLPLRRCEYWRRAGLPKVLLVEDFLNFKENIVVFPHRKDPEKNIHKFYELKNRILRMNKFKNVEFVVTQDMKLSKDDYYKLLLRSKVVFSASDHENFGISTAEATLLGCIPILPNRLCYPEMYDKRCLYDTYDEAYLKVESCLSDYKSWFARTYRMNILNLRKYETAEKVMLGLCL